MVYQMMLCFGRLKDFAHVAVSACVQVCACACESARVRVFCERQYQMMLVIFTLDRFAQHTDDTAVHHRDSNHNGQNAKHHTR